MVPLNKCKEDEKKERVKTTQSKTYDQRNRRGMKNSFRSVIINLTRKQNHENCLRWSFFTEIMLFNSNVQVKMEEKNKYFERIKRNHKESI